MEKLTWSERLAAAEKRKKFVKSDVKDAESWKSGVLSEWKGFYQADEDGIPVGTALYDLDDNFTESVQTNDIESAKVIFNQIQTYMKRNITRRKNPLTMSVASKLSLPVSKSTIVPATASKVGKKK